MRYLVEGNVVKRRIPVYARLGLRALFIHPNQTRRSACSYESSSGHHG
jgi:hypothetical protein